MKIEINTALFSKKKLRMIALKVFPLQQSFVSW